MKHVTYFGFLSSRRLSSVSGHFIHVQSWSKITCVHTYLLRGLYNYIYYNLHINFILDDNFDILIEIHLNIKGYMMDCIGGQHKNCRETAILQKCNNSQNWCYRITGCIFSGFQFDAHFRWRANQSKTSWSIWKPSWGIRDFRFGIETWKWSLHCYQHFINLVKWLFWKKFNNIIYIIEKYIF